MPQGAWQRRTGRPGAAAAALPRPRRGVGADRVALPRRRLEARGGALRAQPREPRREAAVRPLRGAQPLDARHRQAADAAQRGAHERVTVVHVAQHDAQRVGAGDGIAAAQQVRLRELEHGEGDAVQHLAALQQQHVKHARRRLHACTATCPLPTLTPLCSVRPHTPRGRSTACEAANARIISETKYPRRANSSSDSCNDSSAPGRAIHAGTSIAPGWAQQGSERGERHL